MSTARRKVKFDLKPEFDTGSTSVFPSSASQCHIRTALCSARVGPPWGATLEEAHPATRGARADRAGTALWHARGFNNRPWGLKWRRLAAIRQSRAIRWLWRLLSASSYPDLLLLPCTLRHIGSELANDARFKLGGIPESTQSLVDPHWHHALSRPRPLRDRR